MKSFTPNVYAHNFGPIVDFSRSIEDLFVPISDEVTKIYDVLLRPCYLKVSKLTKEGFSKLDDPLVCVNHLGKKLLVERMQSTVEFALKPKDLEVVYVYEFLEMKGMFDP